VVIYQNDHLGTPQKLTAVNGAVVWSAKYSSFGEANLEINTVENNLRFPGQYFDQESGLHFNWFRYYDSINARYLRPDPSFNTQAKGTIIPYYFPYLLATPKNLNPYAYVGENPIVWFDSNGLLSCTYQISVHTLKCKNNAGKSITITGVKAGHGKCKDDPKCVDKPKEGPIPPGEYKIYSAKQTKSKEHPTWMFLGPDSGNEMHDRKGFFIHGWGKSEGCITIKANSEFKTIHDWANQDGGGDLNVTE